ncbi:MAG TPA: autotransporter outer membrane beta-barrel domain-containing protein [Phascolarctobacterium faecium]|uniref:autotransporter outer membrane beta-barrel domain-containing protein n=1 Tax=Phascolarctobacterium faecium TaxID=33025 RepID=UPI00242EE484|nr:autotransporter outer membrane beta-barrel domain-containing protein [Phascolarctobacterium faecium]HJI08640.1 autotransporter outer membrane beta-barrel domain-containing protein [Phascolarctobacterium faecium]
MKNHKDLNKQELMTRQENQRVHLGGKFVSLGFKTKAPHGAGRKKQAEKVLATVVMGMNLVNATAPVAALAAAEQTVPAPAQPLRSQATPLDYAVLPQLVDVVDRAIFASAEAGSSYDGNATVPTMTAGDTQNITATQNGTVGVMSSGGKQHISSGGSGTVSTMSRGGTQFVSSGGMGTVIDMAGGYQTIYVDGVGSVNTIGGMGVQEISGGVGMVSIMNHSLGQQNVIGGTGTMSIMLDGLQQAYNNGTATIDTMIGGQQILMSGIGTVIDMSGGTQTINDLGIGTVSALSGGTQTISSGGTAANTTIMGGTQIVNSLGVVSGTVLSAGVQQVYYGSKLSDITFAGGTQVVMGGATVSDMKVAAGVQQVKTGGTSLDTTINGGVMQLASGGSVSGLTISYGSLELESIVGDSFTIGGTMTVGGGSVNMTDSGVTRAGTPSYETLTINSLSGGATFIMDTDLGSDNDSNSDKITISSAGAGGTCYVQVKDLSGLNGSEVTGAHHQKLITDTDGNLTFVGQNLNTGGLWDIDPTLARGDTLSLSANDWYLVKIAKTANNDTRVLLDAADNSYALWRNTNDSLRSRLGALGNGSEHADGIWARTQAGRFSGAGYEGRYNMYQLGFDQSVNDQSIYGAAADYGDGTGSYEPGSGKDKLKTFSLYGVWRGDNGAYTNVTARYGIVDTELESYGDFPDKAEYKQHAYSVSVEYGKRFDMESGLFIEPNVQFTLGRLGSIDYTTNRGANGYIEGMNSAIGRIGFVMGQKIENGSDIYLKADLLHEFAGERDLQLTSDAGGTNDILTKHNDYGDTWFELGLGGNVRISKTGDFYGEVTRGFGGDINKKWSVNAGLRFTF